jgi:uncharacterized protein YbbK (DUF523 family)
VSKDTPPARPERVLVSACLLGRACRHDARDNRDRALERELAARGFEPVPFCPEEAGGLGTPRPAAWIGEGGAGAVLDGQARVVTEGGMDVTGAFLAGARGALERCRAEGLARAFLKERSPSCGVACTHVGGRVAQGSGITAELLRRSGIAVEGVEGRRE